MDTFKSVLKLLSPLIFLYYLVCIFYIMIFSVIEYEWAIGEEGIENICDVILHFNIDDVSDVGIPFTAAIIFPLIIYSVYRVRQRRFIPVIVTSLLVIYWWWAFFGRFLYC